jgi:5'-nucleotidase (lipoprotein e(P4) family)
MTHQKFAPAMPGPTNWSLNFKRDTPVNMTATYEKLRSLLMLFVLGVLPIAGCATLGSSSSSRASPSLAATDDRLGATLWQTTSAEYRVLAQSIYGAAKSQLERALADRQWTALPAQRENFQHLPPAVIMDIDETVIDTSRFQILLLKTGARFSRTRWRDWSSQNEPEAVPGAIEFISFAQSRGVTVFFVTNRDYATEPLTRKHLFSAGIKLPDTIDTVLSQSERPDWGADKGSRRNFIATSYRVLMLFGDDLADFISEYRSSTQTRMSEAMKHNDWGTKWFMLPNPMYGSWELSLYDFNSGLSMDEISRRKLQHLR